MGMMAMELVCSRSCSTVLSSSTSMRAAAAPLSARPQRATTTAPNPRRVSRLVVRATAEEVGTEEAEKPSLPTTAEVLEPESKNGSSFPKGRKWTGYVEKDTAGQENIYAVEPTVYVGESVFSSGEAGGSAEGTDNSAAILFGFSLIALASAASILLTVGKNAPAASPEAVAAGYSGPPLSYYISKFNPEAAAQASIKVEDGLSVAPDLALPEASA